MFFRRERGARMSILIHEQAGRPIIFYRDGARRQAVTNWRSNGLAAYRVNCRSIHQKKSLGFLTPSVRPGALREAIMGCLSAFLMGGRPSTFLTYGE
jgi:hypothetical protein